MSNKSGRKASPPSLRGSRKGKVTTTWKSAIANGMAGRRQVQLVANIAEIRWEQQGVGREEAFCEVFLSIQLSDKSTAMYAGKELEL